MRARWARQMCAKAFKGGSTGESAETCRVSGWPLEAGNQDHCLLNPIPNWSRDTYTLVLQCKVTLENNNKILATWATAPAVT